MINPNSSHSIPEKVLNNGVAFHGHLGAFLVLGIKAGLFANEKLGKDYFETTVVVKTHSSPPCSCFLDGIQVTTGCTMGKDNIRLEKGDRLKVKFTKGNRQITLGLKATVFEKLMKVTSKEESKQIAQKMVKAPVRELFDVEQ